jgi:hypothetical protein
MGFGKRAHPPGKPPITSIVPAAMPASVTAAPSTPEQRIQDLRQVFLRFLRESGNIATAIRENASIAMPGMDIEIDLLGPPMTLRGFREHFKHTVNGQTMHSVFVYCEAPAVGALDPSAQLHLQTLMARIMDLNRYCQQALKDDALGVALQSPKLPVSVDQIIVGCAYFAGFFDAVAIARPYFMAQPMRALPSAEMARLADSWERHKLMAGDVMLAPDMLAELLPRRVRPIGIETVWKAHAGEKIISEVYFPADGAQAQETPIDGSSRLAAVG